jgi:hypothetical protein
MLSTAFHDLSVDRTRGLPVVPTQQDYRLTRRPYERKFHSKTEKVWAQPGPTRLLNRAFCQRALSLRHGVLPGYLFLDFSRTRSPVLPRLHLLSHEFPKERHYFPWQSPPPGADFFSKPATEGFSHISMVKSLHLHRKSSLT